MIIVFVMFKNRAGVLYRKHEAIAGSFRSDKAHTASFFEWLKKQTLNTSILEESLKINVFEAEKFGGEKEACFYHVKTRHGYDFPYEFLMSFFKLLL